MICERLLLPPLPDTDAPPAAAITATAAADIGELLPEEADVGEQAAEPVAAALLAAAAAAAAAAVGLVPTEEEDRGVRGVPTTAFAAAAAAALARVPLACRLFTGLVVVLLLLLLELLKLLELSYTVVGGVVRRGCTALLPVRDTMPMSTERESTSCCCAKDKPLPVLLPPPPMLRW